MILYISGPMSGIPEFNVPEFTRVATLLRARGYTVVSPPEISLFTEGKLWGEYMRDDISALLHCDAVVRLPGWSNSRGARLENHIAHQLDFPLYDLINDVLTPVNPDPEF